MSNLFSTFFYNSTCNFLAQNLFTVWSYVVQIEIAIIKKTIRKFDENTIQLQISLLDVF